MGSKGVQEARGGAYVIRGRSRFSGKRPSEEFVSREDKKRSPHFRGGRGVSDISNERSRREARRGILSMWEKEQEKRVCKTMVLS